jgi:hypothetical protein
MYCFAIHLWRWVGLLLDLAAKEAIALIVRWLGRGM